MKKRWHLQSWFAKRTTVNLPFHWLPPVMALLLVVFVVRADSERAPNNLVSLSRHDLEIQRLSPAGEAELLAIVNRGELPDLRWPHFGVLQVEVGELYSSIGWSLAWVRSAAPTPQAKKMIELLEGSDRKGLDSEDYDGPRWDSRARQLEQGGSPSESSLLHFDIALTVCAMRYISDLHRGRVAPRAMHFTIDIESSKLDLSEFLRLRILNAVDVEAALAEVEPPFPTYRRTVRALQTYLALANSDDGTPLPVPKRPIEPGETYPGVPRLARLLKLLGDLSQADATTTSTDLYQRPLVDGVKRFQERHGLETDGRIDSETRKALNTPLKRRVKQLQLALERWRWLPVGFKLPAIAVNIPEFRLRAVDENYRWALSMKVVVGTAYRHETPVFTSELRSVTFRPSWTVPLPIQRDELLPLAEKDSSYLSANSYVITDGAGRTVAADPTDPDVMQKLRIGELHLRQEPGPDNALDLIRFDLSDPFDIICTERRRRNFSPGRDVILATAASGSRILSPWRDGFCEAIRNGLPIICGLLCLETKQSASVSKGRFLCWCYTGLPWLWKTVASTFLMTSMGTMRPWSVPLPRDILHQKDSFTFANKRDAMWMAGRYEMQSRADSNFPDSFNLVAPSDA